MIDLSQSPREIQNQPKISQTKEPMSRLGSSYIQGLDQHMKRLDQRTDQSFDEFLNNDPNEKKNFSFNENIVIQNNIDNSDRNSPISSRQHSYRNNPESASI